MPPSLPHPHDASLILSVSKRPFADRQLRVNGVAQEMDDEGDFSITLNNGSRSRIEISGRRFDPYPVLLIDGEPHPLGAELHGAAKVATILPFLLIFAFRPVPGAIFGAIGAFFVLRVARSRVSGALAIVAALGFVFVTGFGIRWLFATFDPNAGPRPRSVDWEPLPTLASIPPGEAARTAFGQIVEAPQVEPVPAGTGLVAPFTIGEVRSLRELLLAGKFTELEAALRTLQRDARTDVRRESRWRAAYRMTFQAIPDSFTPMIDRWIAASPTAPEPLVARAWNRYWIAYYWRGESSPPVNPRRIRGFFNALAAGSADAVDALTLDPDQMPAYWMLMYTARVEGDDEAADGLLARALRRSPTSFESYLIAMFANGPDWGGSLEQMQQLADQALVLADKNPDLRRLQAFPLWKRGDLAVESRTGAGIHDLREALRVAGPDPFIYESLGHAIWHSGNPNAGLPYLDSALILEPTYTRGLETRAKVEGDLAYDSSGEHQVSYLARRKADLTTELQLRPLMEP